jgi:hypothetical protein
MIGLILYLTAIAFLFTERATNNAAIINKLIECPISLDRILDAVIDENGHTFNRAHHDMAMTVRPGVSPITGAPYAANPHTLLPNLLVQHICDLEVTILSVSTL